MNQSGRRTGGAGRSCSPIECRREQYRGICAQRTVLQTQLPRSSYDLTVPVSLTDHGNAEGVLKGLLKVDITFVENPTPGGGHPPFLIDSIKNDLVDANADLATNFPELAFAGGASPVPSVPKVRGNR